jgi:hypothetical protein
MTRSNLRLLSLTLAAGCMVHPGRQATLAAPCAQPSPHTLGAVEDLKGVLANNDSVIAEYRSSLGFAGVEPKSVVAVTDPRTCGAVSAAVGSYLRRSGPMDNLYVVQVGRRYLALDARDANPAQFVLTKKFEVTDYLAP